MASPAGGRSALQLRPEQLEGRSYRFAPSPRNPSSNRRTGAAASATDVEALPRNAVGIAQPSGPAASGEGYSGFSLGGERSQSPSAFLGASYTADDSYIRQRTSQLAGMAFEDGAEDDEDDFYSSSQLSHPSHASTTAARQPGGQQVSSLSLRLAQEAQQSLSHDVPASSQGSHAEESEEDAEPTPRRRSSSRTRSYGATWDQSVAPPSEQRGTSMTDQRGTSSLTLDPNGARRSSTSRMRASIASLHAAHGGAPGINSHALGAGALAQAQEELEVASSGIQAPGTEEAVPSEQAGASATTATRYRKSVRPAESHERTSLLPPHTEVPSPPPSPGVEEEQPEPTKASWLGSTWGKIDKTLLSAKSLTWSDVRSASTEPIRLFPAVLLGVLMNVLDGVSYGMITFPTSYPLFSTFGGDGVSMFFITCIVSQIVYSAGGSTFGGGNGSMMIEVVPFYAMLSKTIMLEIGDDDAAIVTTVIVAFALASVFIGTTFLLLGWLNTSKLLQFIPRHLLVGAIGGVGAFLVVTGFEVAGQLKSEDGFQWNLETLRFFFQSTHVVALWGIPLGLAILLRVITHHFDGPLIFPIYFFMIPIVFYTLSMLALGYSMADLKANKWVFDIGPAGDAPFYRFYTLIDVRKISFKALVATLPTQAALTFFGILHVPLNIPALAISTGEDNVDTDRELIGHGISNLAAGALFSPPNYITYVNSLLFYRVGGGSRLSGFMLAGATFCILLAGPSTIGYLPIMVVAALIFVLGIDLIKEALWDTIGRVSRSEYLTIIVIIFVMTLWDFVAGLLVGVILACCFFVMQNSRRSAVRAVFDGSIARSTVRRQMTQRRFLDVVGSQTQILKLQGFLFFGTINGVEQLIRRALDIAAWDENPIRFLIVDFSLVTGVDFSAAEAFTRVQRLLEAKEVTLIFCGVTPDSEVGIALQSVGIWADEEGHLQVFSNLNSALEWTENDYLLQLYQSGFASRGAGQAPGKSILSTAHALLPPQESSAQPVPTNKKTTYLSDEHLIGSPRNRLLYEAARTAIQAQPQVVPAADTKSNRPTSPSAERCQSHGRSASKADGPYQLLLTTFRGYTDGHIPASFFATIAPYFARVSLRAGAQLWAPGDASDGLYLIERGVLRAVFAFAQEGFEMTETMMPGTVAGEMTFLSHQPRNATVTAEEESILWRLDISALSQIAEQHSESTRRQLVEILLRVSSDEQQALMGYLVSRLT